MIQTRIGQQKGAVAVTFALAAVALIGAVGLAIDSGRAYLLRAQLNSALDAAAIAGGRAITVGDTPEQRRQNAEEAIDKFFAVNFPSAAFGTVVPTAEINSTQEGKITIGVSAQAELPLSFMRVFPALTSGGASGTPVVAAAEVVRRDVDMSFVVDTSGSMSDDISVLRTRAAAFLDNFHPTRDRVALIRFSTGSVVDKAISTRERGFDRASMQRKIANYDALGRTNAAGGMWHARNELNRVDPARRSGLRVIVFFSDGAPNSFASYFPTKSGAPRSCGNLGVLASHDTKNSAHGLKYPKRVTGKVEATFCDVRDETASRKLQGLPEWYNEHNPEKSAAKQEFRIVGPGYRTVTSSVTKANIWKNVNRAARNLPEAIAVKARSEGIHVFTLGLGQDRLETPSGPDGEHGSEVLKCMANIPDYPRCYNPSQPRGEYCLARDQSGLATCFNQLASAILRLTK